MISIEEAQQILKENQPPPRITDVCLSVAHGCCLAEDIFAPEPSPRYTNSAMDGYAVRWSDVQVTTKNAPVSLQIIGESMAGVPFEGNVGSGETTQISTGAMMPHGADTVVRVEDTDGSDEEVRILAVRKQGQDVRHAGEEFQAGTKLLKKGTVLRSRELALLGAVGSYTVSIFNPPKVSLLITGTELTGLHEKEIKPHQIRDSNSIMLASAVKEAGGVLLETVTIQDNLESTIQAITKSLNNKADIILCSGGVSVGRHDHVKNAAEAAGFKQLFWRIRQKPGKPLFACLNGRTLLFGLPGNPVSAYMCFSNYVKPILATFQGFPTCKNCLTAVVEEEIANHDKRTNFIRVIINKIPKKIPSIKKTATQGSHMLSSIVHADGYIILQPGEVLTPDNLVKVFLF
ncbi:MAG: molybdopterin molybdotransferase MoeA [Desulfobacterales bacterium]|jgi:molybdopterin molybdotransferase|nr:molybdopterin molybdotransferase MoeA [Desulfobacterales bacterium]